MGCDGMNREFIKARITATEALIEQFENALEALTVQRVQSYTIDTGQTRQNVTRLDLASLQAQLEGLYNRLATLEARLNGASFYGRSAF